MNSLVTQEYVGRHYETGTIANWLAASGHTVSEAHVLAASGGIAFGYFVFEYKGCLPHVALLPRNTFAPFERALDNLGVRRDQRETTNAQKAEENLRRELDFGRPVIVWADFFSAGWNLLPTDQMWMMAPMLVVGHQPEGFWVVSGSARPFLVSTEEMSALRGRVKKDRYRILVLEGVDEPAQERGLQRGLETCCALFLDKPPAGSVKNFGISGMEEFSKMLRNDTVADGWGKRFGGNQKFVHAVAGAHGQPGVYDWIARWGTDSAADRRTFAECLIGAGCQEAAEDFVASALLWASLADAALPDEVAEFAEIKELRRESDVLRWTDPLGSILQRQENLGRQKELLAACNSLEIDTMKIRQAMADKMDEIREVEADAVLKLRSALA